MPRDPPVVYLYPLSNYQQGSKGPLLEKDSSVKERMLRMADLYTKFGMRRVVEGLLIAHEHSHPHVLLLQIGNTYFKLPGGRLRVGEHETDGLRRKLTNKLGTPVPDSTVNWQIGELVSTWWRPNFETVMYPYIPPQVAGPKECRKIFLTQLPPTGILGVPKNLKLLAVPLFELYDNAHRYGPVIASLPQLLARVKFVCCDHNAQPLMNQHIKAYQMTNIQIYNKIQKAKKNKSINGKPENTNNIMTMAMHLDMDKKEDIVMNKTDGNMNSLMNTDSAINEANNGGVMNVNNINNQNVLSALNVNKLNLNNNGLGLNPLLNYRAGLMNNIYAQNLLQRQLMAQQIMAQNMLRMSSPTLRAPNARLILTPTLQSPQANPISNPLVFQQMLAQQQQQQQMLPQAIQPPQTTTSTAQNTQAQTTNANTQQTSS